MNLSIFLLIGLCLVVNNDCFPHQEGLPVPEPVSNALDDDKKGEIKSTEVEVVATGVPVILAPVGSSIVAVAAPVEKVSKESPESAAASVPSSTETTPSGKSEAELHACAGVTCGQPTIDDATCTVSSNPEVLGPAVGNLAKCCPLWTCTKPDGSFFTHFEVSSVNNGNSHSESKSYSNSFGYSSNQNPRPTSWNNNWNNNYGSSGPGSYSGTPYGNNNNPGSSYSSYSSSYGNGNPNPNGYNNNNNPNYGAQNSYGARPYPSWGQNYGNNFNAGNNNNQVPAGGYQYSQPPQNQFPQQQQQPQQKIGKSAGGSSGQNSGDLWNAPRGRRDAAHSGLPGLYAPMMSSPYVNSNHAGGPTELLMYPRTY